MSALLSYSVPVLCSWCGQAKRDEDGEPIYTESAVNQPSHGACKPCAQRVLAAAKALRRIK